MLKFDEICDLVRLVGSSGVARVDIEHEGSRIQIEGRPAPVAVAAAPVASGEVVPQPVAPPPAEEPAAGRAPDAVEDGAEIVPSPIVGTFYRAPNPEAEPYVKVGDVISEGQVLCIVEAMKLMNEIKAEVAGTVVKVFPENAEPVEFGQPLFAVRPA